MTQHLSHGRGTYDVRRVWALGAVEATLAVDVAWRVYGTTGVPYAGRFDGRGRAMEFFRILVAGRAFHPQDGDR